MAEEISRKSVIYDILYDFSKGNKSAKDAEKNVKGVEKSVGGLENVFKKAAGAFAALFAVQKVSAFIKESIKAFDIAAKAEQQLLVALKGRQDIQQRLIAQAKELQKTTLFSDDDTVRAQSLIAAFVKEEAALKRVIPLVQDFATAKSMDLAGAADLVSKTLGSSTNALSRYGIEVTGAVGSTERLTSLTTQLEKAFGGSAEAAAKAGAGGLTQLQNIVNDMQESFGQLFVTLFNASGAGGVIIDFAETLGDLAKVITGLVTGQNLFNDALDESLEKAAKFTQEQSDTLLASANAIGKLNKIIEVNGRAFTDAEMNAAIATELLAIQQERLAKATEESTASQIRNINFLNEEITKYEELIKTTGTATNESRKQTAKYTEEINKLKQEIELILTPIGSLNKLTLENVEVNKLGQKSIEEQTRGRKGDIKSIGETIKALGELAKAQEKISVEATDPSKAGTGLMEKRIETARQYLVASQELNTALNSLQESVTNNSAAYQKDADALAQALQNKLITQEQYNQGVEQLNRDKARADLAFTLAEIAINSGLAIASIVKSASQTAINPIQAIVEIVAGIAAVLAGISQAYSAVSAAQYEEGTEYLKRGKNKAGKDTIPIMANEGEAIIPTDKNLSEPGLAKAWIDGDLDRYIYRNYVMPEMLKANGKGRTDKDYSERFYRQLSATQEQTYKQVSLLRSIDSKLNGGADYRSRYGRA